MIVVITWIQLEHCVNSLGLIECLNLFRVLSDIPQDWVPGLALLISQRKVHTIWPLFRFMGEDILFHAWKPERAGYAAYTGKQVCLVDGIQRKQPRQRIPSDPSPTRSSVNLLLCRWDDLLGQEPQLVVRTTSARLSIFEGRWTVPGHHVVVPVQITDGHQRERRTASGLRGFKYLLSLVGEGVEIDNRGLCFSI